MSFVRKIADSIASHRLLSTDGIVIAALSGGADSVALLAALTELGYECVAVHCNFHLRGEESNRDEAHARSVADRLGVPFRVTHFDVHDYCRNHGVSVEMACRELRYKWFERVRSEIGAQAIAVAHHRDDNIETFFLNLLRGSGIAGLSAMKSRNGNIVRPMLQCTRAETEQFLSERNLGYVTDSTNLQNDFKRNKLRNIVLPVLRVQFPDADDAIARSIECIEDNHRFYAEAVDKKYVMYCSGGTIELKELLEREPCGPLLLYEWLRREGFNYSQISDMVSSAGHSGKIFVSDECTYLLDRGRLLRQNVHSDVGFGKFPFEMTVSERSEFAPTGDPFTAYFDVSVLDAAPEFEVRCWRSGDRIAPYGMRGTKKISDLFSDAKLSIADKQRVPILTRNDEIIWVVGLRASRMFAVTDSTQRFVTLRYIDKDK